MTTKDFAPDEKVRYVGNSRSMYDESQNIGIVSSTNDKWVFVRFVHPDGGYQATGQACNPNDLQKL